MPQNKEIGVVGLDEWSGQIREDFLRELRGKEAIKRYNEMRLNSPVIGALITAIKQSILSIEWTYSSEEGEEDPRLEILNESWDAMSHNQKDHITEALTFLPFGHSIFEIVYQRVGAHVLWRKFAPRGQDTVWKWDLDEQGGMQGIVQQTVRKPTLTPIPIEKLIVYRINVEKNNPEGRSILRPAWIPYYYAKNIMQIEAIGIERDLAGLPTIVLPENANTDESDTNSDYSKAHKLVRNIRNDEQAGVVVPFGWEIKLLSTGGSRQFNTDEIVKRYESRMLMSALAQFLMLGQENVGSLALSRDQTDFFTMAVNATADVISDTHTTFAIPRLMRLNGYTADGLRFDHTQAGDIDIKILGEFLTAMSPFITWTTEDEIWLRQTAKLPERAPEEIDEVKEQKRSMLGPMLEGLRKKKEEQEGEEEEEMGAEYYAAPDDEERQRFERRWERTIRSFFADQKKRVMKAAKGIRRE